MADLQGGSVVWEFKGDLSGLGRSLAEASRQVAGFGRSLSGVSGKNLFSGFSTSANSAAKSVTNSFSQTANSSTGSLNKIGQAASVNTQHVTKLGDAGGSALSNLGSRAAASGNAIAASGRSFSQMAGSIAAGTLATVAITTAMSGARDAVTSFVQGASNVEQARIAFETMLGSADAARTMLQNLSDFAVKTPFTFPTIVDAAKQILAYGVSANEILPTIKALGDITAGVGTDKLPQLTLAFGQVRASGKLFGTELRQFTEAGVPLLEELAKASGKSTAQIRSDMEAGVGPSFRQVQQALFSMTQEGGRFFNLMEKQSNTFGGVMSNITDQIQRVGRAILGITETGDIVSGGPFDRLRNAAKAFLDFLNANSGRIAQFFQAGISVAGAIISALVPILRFLRENIKTVVLAFGFLISALIAFRIASFLAAAANPLTVFLILLSVLAGSVVSKAFDKLSAKIGGAFGGGSGNKALDKLIKDLQDGVPGGAEESAKSLNKVAEELANINEQITKAKRDFKEQLAEMIKSHQDKVTSIEKQLKQENDAFSKSQAEREADFLKSQNELRTTHEDRLISLQQQLDKELTSSKNTNSLKVRDVKASLQQEKTEYAKTTAEKQAQYQQDVANATATHSQKIAELTTELNTEKALLDKHAADVKSVRNVILLDEIDKLKRSNTEQLSALDKQKKQVLKNAGDVSAGLLETQKKFVKAAGEDTKTANNTGQSLGKSIGSGMMDALFSVIKTQGLGLARFFDALGKTVLDVVKLKHIREHKAVMDIFQENFDKSNVGGNKGKFGRAAGGPVKGGFAYVVGEQGPELFVPNQSGSIVPNDEVRRSTGSRSGATVNANFQVYNNVDLTQGLRQLAWDLRN